MAPVKFTGANPDAPDNACEPSLELSTSQPSSRSARRSFSTTFAACAGVKYMSTLRQKIRSMACVSVASEGKLSSARFSGAKRTRSRIRGSTE